MGILKALSLDPEICGIYNPPVLSFSQDNPIIRRIQDWGLGSLAAALLEHGGAFAQLAAQSVYIAEPLLGTWLPNKRLRSFAHMMEDPGQRMALAAALRDPHA